MYTDTYMYMYLFDAETFGGQTATGKARAIPRQLQAKHIVGQQRAPLLSSVSRIQCQLQPNPQKHTQR